MRVRISGKIGREYLISSTKTLILPLGQEMELLTLSGSGTERQRRFFFKLLLTIYRSRAWSFDGLSESQHDHMGWRPFIDHVLLHFGSGVDRYVWVDNGVLQQSKKPPENVYPIFAMPKSFAQYSKQERTDVIDNVLNWADAIGVSALIENFRTQLLEENHV